MNQFNIQRADLNLLIVFEALLAEKHVGRAAERLHLTQSAVSHALARLRNLFSDPLFVRNPKGVEATPRALDLAPSIADVLSRIRNLIDFGREFDPSGSNRFVIGATDGAFPLLLLPAIQRIRQLAPNTEICIITLDPNNVVSALDRMEIDVAIMPMLHVPSRMHRIPLINLRYKGIARHGHPAFVDGIPDLTTFAALPHVTVSARPDLPSLVDRLLATVGVHRRVVMIVPQFLAIPLVVRKTDLVAILDVGVASLYRDDPDLDVFDMNFGLDQITIDLVISAGRTVEPGLAWLRTQIMSINPA